jgi:hypothetical protein
VLDAIRIDPDAFYNDGQLRLVLGVTTRTLTQARRAGHLCFTRKGRRLLYRGEWVIDWLKPSQTQKEESHVS